MKAAINLSRAAQFQAQQFSFDFDSYMSALQQTPAVSVKPEVVYDQAFVNAFIRPENDPHGMYAHSYLCQCGEHWHVRNDYSPESDLCPHCHTECDPFLTDDGSFKPQQLENILFNERMRIAFKDFDIGRKVMDDFISKSAMMNFIAEDVGEIAYR